MKQLYNRYFPTPSFLVMNSCALDVSDQSIKYGELKSTPHGLRLGRFGQVKIPAGVVVSGKIENEDKLVSILSSLAQKENLRFVRVSLPEEQMYLFTLSLPAMHQKDIRDTILLQIEEHIPLKADNTIFDYDIISLNEQSIFVEVVAVSVLTIESYLSVFEKAGVVPVSFELEAQALARAVIPFDDPKAVMIVDFGETRTGVSIAEKGRVLFTTTLDIGGVAITNMIAKNFSLSFEEAEAMKRSYAIDAESNIDDIFPVILNGISVLRDELVKHSIYWQTHEDTGISHGAISRIILCGGDANLTGLADYLQASMKIKVDHANTWVNISNMEISVPDMVFQDSLGYGTVLGLALGDYTSTHTALINVLPEEEKKTLRREYRMRLTSMILSFCTLIFILATILIFPSYFYSKSKSALAEAQLEDFNKANPEIATHDLDTAITDINTKLVLLAGHVQPSQIVDKVYDPLFKARIPGISFSQVFYTEGEKARKIEIHGVASTRASLRAFKESLDANSSFSEVVLPISNFVEKSDITFIITASMK